MKIRKGIITTIVAGEERQLPHSPLNEALTIHGERLDDHMHQIRALEKRVGELEQLLRTIHGKAS